ncbi:Battenin [Camponotus floridanus]|uniref:Battenin n=1 Tax=Camponotus floridanus TaxID=104421 RepID=E2A915_CAMFO|nr:battenin [Camponotus floridanus]XP_011253724.1 battenin [Camponotus floridanus]XP_011253725.1 battenin [Camponotus floridanus]XP_011253726.1 battenin [Camponotus floridanus]EFN70074.1 Battenin [Camponotus floridanus]
MNKDKPSNLDVAENIFEEATAKKTQWRNLLAFWILGLCNNYGYVVMLSAAHDILDIKFSDKDNSTLNTNGTNMTGIRMCNTVSTGAILLADILPSLAIKMIAPFLPFLVHARLATCVLFSAAGFLMVSLSTVEWLALLGVVITSLSSGLGEATLLGYSNQFSKQVISTWSSGTGGAGVIGALSYASLATVLSVENTLLVMLIVPLLQGITFWCVLKHPVHTKISINGVENQEQIIKVPEKSIRDKFKLIPGLLKYMIPLGLVYLFEYFINQGLYELIEFDNIWLTQHEQYRWLQVDYQIGVFISRSSVNVVTINKIWIMSVFQLINVIILLFETLFYYIPNIWIVFALVLWEGLLGGGAYVNTFFRISTEIPKTDRETSLEIATMSDAIGIALAGWLSMPVHNAICKLPQPKRLGS